MENFSLHLGKYNQTVVRVVQRFQKDQCVERIAAADYTLWKNQPTEIVNRLGWLKSPQVMMPAIEEINEFVATVRASGFKQALLLGMGGSSLAPEVYTRSFGTKAGFLDLTILDSTDPGAVLAKERSLDLSSTLFIVSTKSGGTVETFSLFKYFYNRINSVIGSKGAGDHFIAITDGGSGLEKTAKELKFQRIFLNDPDIGGRYSALSYFGLVPAALIGVDVKELLTRAGNMMDRSISGEDKSPLQLGTAMGTLAGLGMDKLTLILSPLLTTFAGWIEQLVAESTGKEGKGIVPVAGEEMLTPELYSPDRLFVSIQLSGDENRDEQVAQLINSGRPVIKNHLRDLYDLGTEIYRWELATAVAGVVLKVNPFDQPNVESAKVLARKIVADYQKTGKAAEIKPTFVQHDLKVYTGDAYSNFKELFSDFFNTEKTSENDRRPSRYLSLQAYLKPSAELDQELQGLRNKFQLKYNLATTVGYGPRFLHSTGQLHKGGGGGLFIQFLADMPEDIPIPDEAGKSSSSISFGILKNAQAWGDRQALIDAGKRIITIDLGGDALEGLRTLFNLIK